MKIAVLLLDASQAKVSLWRPDYQPEVSSRPFGTEKEHRSLIGAIANLLEDARYPIEQITHIGAMRGPDHYTRLRATIATANALAWALRWPIFAWESDARLPDDLPKLITTARTNCPIEPKYPTTLSP